MFLRCQVGGFEERRKLTRGKGGEGRGGSVSKKGEERKD